MSGRIGKKEILIDYNLPNPSLPKTVNLYVLRNGKDLLKHQALRPRRNLLLKNLGLLARSKQLDSLLKNLKG